MIGIDLSSIVDKTRQVIARNGFAENVFVVQGKVEDSLAAINNLLDEDEKVSVVISEWMGYALYFENMLPSVLFARDHLLAPEGHLMPAISTLFVEMMQCSSPNEDRVSMWNDVYGLDMSDLVGTFVQDVQVQLVDRPNDNIMSNRYAFHTLNIGRASNTDLDFCSNFTLVIFSS